MRASIKRAGAAALATVGIAAGSLAGTAPAQAVPGVHNLQMIGGINCYWKGWGPTWDNLPGWRMHRWMGVKNTGSQRMHGVTVTELFGAAKSPNFRGQPARSLKPGQTFIAFDTTWEGCWPSSISGYAIATETEDLLDNWGFWANVRQERGDQSEVTPGE
ncbi:hypothetical protein VZC37_23255 [Gordonia sp. LSe1-13]|uniref:DUF4232 domain-containing protein n=1 Tax=Gordonia sesuvii TaxID=3116777 RepID=A0ABU7MJI4_9ACTN|nr:hypothetical protein [Gordonia sp. LSe1-13]